MISRRLLSGLWCATRRPSGLVTRPRPTARTWCIVTWRDTPSRKVQSWEVHGDSDWWSRWLSVEEQSSRRFSRIRIASSRAGPSFRTAERWEPSARSASLPTALASGPSFDVSRCPIRLGSATNAGIRRRIRSTSSIRTATSSRASAAGCSSGRTDSMSTRTATSGSPTRSPPTGPRRATSAVSRSSSSALTEKS